MRFKKIVIMLGASLMMLPACKPTESNYREAYDVAKAKAEKTAAEMDADGIVNVDAPQMKVVGNDTVYMKSAILRPDNPSDELRAYNLVVAEFKMPTNARSGASMIKEKGFEAFPARSTLGRWYIVAGTGHTLPEAIELTKRFRETFPTYPYIGLFGHPTLIRK